MDLDALDRQLHAEADALLAGGLRAVLSEYGRPILRGSYVLGLMTWRDLDIHLIAPDLALARFLELGARIGSHLSASKLNFRDHRGSTAPDVPSGLYWGIYLGDERAGAWKLDLWAFDSLVADPAENREAALAARLQPELRAAIMSIKSAVWQDPGYRRNFSSQDIYAAVLDAGVRTAADFRSYLQRD